MKDVAAYCRWRFILEAILRIPVGLLLIVVAFVAVPAMVRDEVAKGHGSWGELGFGLIPLLIGYLIFSSGTRRLHAAVLTNCWFKAGPDGLAFRVPYNARPQTLFLTHKIAERTVPWPDVLKVYPLQYRVNGIPFGRSLVLQTRQGRYNFGGYFKEPPEAIIAFMQAARTG
jgi:hypothetical protein